MRAIISQHLQRHRTLAAALVMVALAGITAPRDAAAKVTANTKLLNVATVDYYDAGGHNNRTATASATVTVQLVPAPLDASTPPTPTGGLGGLGCTGAVDTVSNSTFSSLSALTATANGTANYSQTAFTNTPNSANNVTATYSLLTWNGTGFTTTAGPMSNRPFGSAIPLSAKNATTLYFPGGTLTGSGFAANDIVVVEVLDGSGTGTKVKKAYIVSSISTAATNAPAHTNAADQAYTVPGTTRTETLDEMVLAKFPSTAITINGSSVNIGSDTDPAFTTALTLPTFGVPVGELVLVKVDVTASASSITADGTVDYTLTVASGSQSTDISCTAGNFKRTRLDIQKGARNCGPTNSCSGGFSATATGVTNDIIEYQITVTNIGGQASSVFVTDAVPKYTSLITGSAYGTIGGGAIFAKISDNAGTPHTVDITTTVADSETQELALPYATGYGKTTGAATVAETPITFYLGNNSTNGAGGTVPSCTTADVTTAAACTTAAGTWLNAYTILYRVKID